MQIIDLNIGLKLGDRKVIKFHIKTSRNKFYLIQCICQRIYKDTIHHFKKTPNTCSARSCGKYYYQTLIGKTFGKRILLEFAYLKKNRNYYKTKCICGKEEIITISSLLAENKNQCRSCSKTTHGVLKNNQTSSEYNSWQSMKKRCLNKKHHAFPLYGGRGVTIYEPWINSFENFINNMGLKPNPLFHLDRINPDGNYEPNNCRWVSASDNSKNKRNSIQHRDKYITVKKTDLCENCKINLIKEKS